jgi:hypothetical protein
LAYIEKAIYLIDTQVDFTERQMYIEKSLVKCPLYKPESSVVKLKWTGKIVDYVEWVYALYGVLNLNDGNVTLKTLFDIFNGIFGLEVKDFSLYFMSIKNRKKGDRTSFLDLGKRLLIERMEESDRKPSRK